MWPRVLETPTRGWRSSFRCAMREGDHDVAGRGAEDKGEEGAEEEGEEGAEEGGEEGAGEGGEEGREVGGELLSVDGMRRLAEDLVENEL